MTCLVASHAYMWRKASLVEVLDHGRQRQTAGSGRLADNCTEVVTFGDGTAVRMWVERGVAHDTYDDPDQLHCEIGEPREGGA